jgi:hypothetical protein
MQLRSIASAMQLNENNLIDAMQFHSLIPKAQPVQRMRKEAVSPPYTIACGIAVTPFSHNRASEDLAAIYAGRKGSRAVSTEDAFESTSLMRA